MAITTALMISIAMGLGTVFLTQSDRNPLICLCSRKSLLSYSIVPRTSSPADGVMKLWTRKPRMTRNAPRAFLYFETG
ncbi:hypothetical protein F5B19DRAFT_443587 [Rostrohypoxylon terebratum]|nr:hypothetical protein F5B19DRAFT_443587 [Rostrohypoxylon terebratum]